MTFPRSTYVDDFSEAGIIFRPFIGPSQTCGPFTIMRETNQSCSSEGHDKTREMHAHLRLGKWEGRWQAAVGCVSAQSVEHLYGACNIASEAMRVPTRLR